MSTPTLYERAVAMHKSVHTNPILNSVEKGHLDFIYDCLQEILKPVGMRLSDGAANRAVAAETVCACVGRYFALRDVYTAGGGGDLKQIHEAIQGIREAYADYLKTCK